MSNRFRGEVVVVTGGAGGIGAATARRFAAEGAHVIVLDLDVSSLDAELIGVPGDVSREEDVAAAVSLADERYGRLDVFFNNAGVLGTHGSIEALELAGADRTIAINLRGPLAGMKHAARVMKPQESGIILTTSSPAAFLGGIGPHVYSATKAALIGLTRSVAAELRPHGVRVNAIVPGATVTGMTATATTGDPRDLEAAHDRLAPTAKMGRPLDPSDVAAAALFLASDDAAMITGVALPVDAGLTHAPGESPYATGERAAAGWLGPA